METMERSTVAGEETNRQDRRPLTVVLVAVVTLLLGGLAGWMLWGSSDDTGTDDVVEVATGELTDRQDEMVTMAAEHTAALEAGDSEALVALYAPDGVLVIPDQASGDAVQFRVDDTTMASRTLTVTAEMMSPTLVLDNMTVQMGTWGSDPITVVHQFTTDGDPLILNTDITR